MSGSGASNLGYGNTTPFSNVNDSVNKLNVHDSASLSSNVIPTGGYNGHSGIKDNILAASGNVNSSNFFKGGAKRRSLRKKIKNIVKKYRMKTRRVRSRLRRRFFGSRRQRRHHRKSRSMKYYGGYKAYMSDTAYGQGYSLGGPMEIAAGKNIALANPPLQHKYIGGANSGVPQLQTYPCTTGCMDFYNHYNKTCAQTPLK